MIRWEYLGYINAFVWIMAIGRKFEDFWAKRSIEMESATYVKTHLNAANANTRTKFAWCAVEVQDTRYEPNGYCYTCVVQRQTGFVVWTASLESAQAHSTVETREVVCVLAHFRPFAKHVSSWLLLFCSYAERESFPYFSFADHNTQVNERHVEQVKLTKRR